MHRHERAGRRKRPRVGADSRCARRGGWRVSGVELGRGGFEIACAKMLADRAAQLVTAAADQTHGAIGMTKEYPLHYLTRRLWAWRDEAGGHDRWAHRLGAALVARGPDALYPAIQCGSEVVQ